MTTQDINLYRLVLSTRPQKRLTQLWRVGFAGASALAVAYCLMLTADVALKHWSLKKVSEQYTQMSHKLTVLKSQMVAPDKGDPTATFDVLSERLQRAMRERQTLEQVIAKPGPGFSATFVALARQHLQGLWLTSIERGAGIESLQVKGRAIDPALVPKFVRKLAGESVLQGASFQLLKIYLPDEEESGSKGVVEFVAGHDEGGGK